MKPRLNILVFTQKPLEVKYRHGTVGTSLPLLGEYAFFGKQCISSFFFRIKMVTLE